MWEAQQETMTQTFTVTYPKRRINKRDIERPDSCFRRPAADTPQDLGQVTGERLTQTQDQKTRYRKTGELLRKTCHRNACRSSAGHWRAINNTTEKGSENEYDTLVTRASALLVALLPPLHLWQVRACTPKMMLGPPAGGVAG